MNTRRAHLSSWLRRVWTRASLSSIALLAVATLPRTSHAQGAGGEGAAREVDLPSALSLALAAHPQLAVAASSVAEARGRLIAAGTYPFNPVLSATVGPRLGSGTTDLGVELEQEFELGGKGGYRQDVARDDLAAAKARQQRDARLLVARVHMAFVGALQARDELEVARLDRELTQRLLDLTQRRLERGAATQLEVNLAAAELGRAEAVEQSIAGHYLDTRHRLGAVLGSVEQQPPVPAGTLELALDAVPNLSRLLSEAPKNRADLEALRRQERANRARVDLAEAGAWPNITVRAFLEREGGTDTIVGGGISVPLPLFQRQQGQAAESRASLARTQAERATLELEAKSDTAAAHARYSAAAASSARLRERVVGTLDENLRLLARAVEAGKATWSEVLVLRRSFIEARRTLIAVAAERRRAWIELQLTAGLFAVPPDDSVTKGTGR